MGIFQKNEEFLFPPKLGEKITITITGEMERVKSSNAQFNYKLKNNIDSGYYDLLSVEGKKMKINTWKLYFALKDINPEIGDTIEISHMAKGEYIITKK